MTIGVMDFNFDFASPELDFHAASQDRDPENVALYEAQIGESATTDQHGQAVAVVAAGVKNNNDTHGVAFDAEVLAVDFFSGVNKTFEVDGSVTYHVSDPWTYMTSNGARVINKSLGFDEDDIIVDPPDVDEKYVVEWDTVAVQNGALLVSSAGNDGESNPSLSNLTTISQLTGLGILNSGPGAFIIAGAVNDNNQIASFSDRAGSARNNYMVAPGVEIVFPWNGVLVIGNGTSFAAPHIVGAAAIIFDRWPSLTAREVMNILFDSATDLGLPGVDRVYGHGLLNLDAALQPLGTSTFAVEGTSSGPMVTGTGLILSTAFGDGGSLGSGLTDVMMLDGFSRDFSIDLRSFVGTTSRRSFLTDVLDQRRNWQSTTLRVGETGHVSFSVAEDRRASETASLLLSPHQPYEAERDLVLEFSATAAGLNLTAGTGRALGDAGQNMAFDGNSLTEAFRHPVDRSSGTYAVAGLPLGKRSAISLGVAAGQVDGIDDHPVAGLQSDASTYTAALSYDRIIGKARLGVELGALLEDGSLLGSRAAGGLSLTDQSATTWITLSGQRAFSNGIFLLASISGARTDPGNVQHSIVSDVGTIMSTSFSLGVGRYSTFQEDDALSFTVHQPLHVETAPLTIVSGTALDGSSGAVMFGARDLSLAPSGREVALETAYRARFGNWIGEANLAYSFDADHVQGRRDAAFMLTMARAF